MSDEAAISFCLECSKWFQFTDGHSDPNECPKCQKGTAALFERLTAQQHVVHEIVSCTKCGAPALGMFCQACKNEVLTG